MTEQMKTNSVTMVDFVDPTPLSSSILLMPVLRVKGEMNKKGASEAGTLLAILMRCAGCRQR